MAKEASLVVVMDEHGIHTEVKGDPSAVMFMAEKALTGARKALESVEEISDEDARKLMNEVIASYQAEAIHGPDYARIRAMMNFIRHC